MTALAHLSDRFAIASSLDEPEASLAEPHPIAALASLADMLGAAIDEPSLESNFAAWLARHAPACGFALHREGEPNASGEVPCARSLVVPVLDSLSLVFTGATPALSSVLRVATGLFGVALARLLVVRPVSPSAEPPPSAPRAVHHPLGASSGARLLSAKLPRIAVSDASVLIEGETGVGKNFIARIIHGAGPRAAEPLRIVNCAAIPENLFESELFGHERGSFTGAVSRRIGALEETGRGTLLLDEIGELTLAGQAKLLRVLEDRRFERLGSNRPIELRARILCATNRNLEERIACGEFRSDLLFRIAVLRIHVPSLRERAADLPELAERLLFATARSASRRVTGFSPNALAVLQRHAWPGNVRELRNVVEYAVAMGEGPRVEVDDLPRGVRAPPPEPDDPDAVRLPLDMHTLERRAMESALRATNGNRARAAILLGVSRSTFYNKLKEHGFGE